MKRIFTRSEAIDILKNIDRDFADDEDFEPEDWDNADNEYLGEGLCTSGYIHDDHFGGVVDD